MNTCACIVGSSSSFLPPAGVATFRYPPQTPHFVAIQDAMERGYSMVIMIDDAIFDPCKLFTLSAILQQIQVNRNWQCVFLGGEQYGPLLNVQASNPLFSIKTCTITHCSHAYVLRHAGMTKMINEKTIKPTLLTWKTYSSATVVPSIASAHSCPPWVKNLPKIPMILPKFEDHRKFQEFLEIQWQSFIKSVICYTLFAIISERVKRTIIDNCT